MGKMSELDWSWQTIAQALLWKLAPGGVVLFPHELNSLPHDRVLLEERLPDRINLTFITLKEAHARTHADKPENRATTDKMTGRWRQIACVMLWKLSKTGVTLVEYDRQAIPHELILMTAGHRLGVEWQWIHRSVAAKQRMQLLEDTGKDIMERQN
jgi:hypothetical protein